MSVVLLVLLLWTGVAWAQFVEPPLIEDCNVTQDPLLRGGLWGNDVFNAPDSAALSANGTVCLRNVGPTGGTYGRGWWTTSLGPDMAISATLTDALSTSPHAIELFVRLQGPGVNTADGYACRVIDIDDTVQLSRFDNAAMTVLSTCTPVAINTVGGDRFGCQMVGTSLKAYLNTGASWVEVCSSSDATYSGAGFVGLGLGQGTSLDVDDIHAGTVTPAAAVVGHGAIMPLLQ